MKLLGPRWSLLLQAVLFVCLAAYFLLLFVLPPLRFYKLFWLQNFDYGILYDSSQKLANLQAPFVTTRGTHSWADNQDYFQILFAPLHHLPYPHYSLLTLHALAIFACGVFCFLYLRRQGFVALLPPVVVWTSPYLVNMSLDLFHTEAFATILLLLMFYGAARGRPGCFGLGAVLALACKEDVAITVGAFMALALLRPALLRLERRYYVAGLLAACLVFVVNQGIVLPHYKLVTCRWLDADMSPQNIRAGPISPWFADIWGGLLSPSYYRVRFLQPEVLKYLGLLLWPVVPFVHSTFPMTLLPFAGALINLLGSGYLIQSAYHYDHSTYASVIIVMLLGLERASYKKILGALLVAAAVWVNLYTPTVRMKMTAAWTSGDFWYFGKDERTVFVERLNEALPPDLVISADYATLNYLLRGRMRVYMFENPFRPDNFGIYGLCDGVVGAYRTVPAVDLTVVRGGYNMAPNVRAMLGSGYEHERFTFSNGTTMEFFINPASRQHDQIVAALRELGATAVAPEQPANG